MAKSVFLLCLTALLCGAALARVGRQEITNDRPGFNSVAGAAAADLADLASDNLGGGGGRGGGRGMAGGMGSAFDPSSRRPLPHHFRGSRRGGGGAGGQGRGELAWHRRRFGGEDPRLAMMEQETRGRGNQTASAGRAGLHRMAQPMSKAAEHNAARRLPHQRTLENMRADLRRYHQMAIRRHGQDSSGQGRHGFPDVGRFDADGPHHGDGMDGRSSMMSQRNGGRGPHLNWFPGGHRQPANDLRGHGRPRGGHGGYHGIHMMGHGGAGRFMGGHHRRGGYGMGSRFAVP